MTPNHQHRPGQNHLSGAEGQQRSHCKMRVSSHVLGYPREKEGGDRRRREFEEARSREMKRVQKNEKKRRVSLKMASCNFNSFAVRAVYVAYIVAHN